MTIQNIPRKSLYTCHAGNKIAGNDIERTYRLKLQPFLFAAFQCPERTSREKRATDCCGREIRRNMDDRHAANEDDQGSSGGGSPRGDEPSRSGSDWTSDRGQDHRGNRSSSFYSPYGDEGHGVGGGGKGERLPSSEYNVIATRSGGIAALVAVAAALAAVATAGNAAAMPVARTVRRLTCVDVTRTSRSGADVAAAATEENAAATGAGATTARNAAATAATVAIAKNTAGVTMAATATARNAAAAVTATTTRNAAAVAWTAATAVHPERAAAAARKGGRYSTSNSPHRQNVKCRRGRLSPTRGSSGRSSSSRGGGSSSNGCRRRPCARHQQEARHHIPWATQRTLGVWVTERGGTPLHITRSRRRPKRKCYTRHSPHQRHTAGSMGHHTSITPVLLPGSGSRAKAPKRPNQRGWDRIRPQPTRGHWNPATRKGPKGL